MDYQNYKNNRIHLQIIYPWDNKCLGGTGNRVPIKLLVNKTFKAPWILAGGISSEISERIDVSFFLKEEEAFGLDGY